MEKEEKKVVEMDDVTKRVVEFINVYIAKNKITQGEFASKLGMRQPHISGLFNGERKAGMKIINGIAKVMNGNINWLMTGEGEMFIDDLVLKENEADYKSMYFNKEVELMALKKELDAERKKISKLAEMILSQSEEIEMLKNEIDKNKKSGGFRSA